MPSHNIAESGSHAPKNFFLVDSSYRGLNLPDVNEGSFTSFSSDRVFYGGLVLKGVISTVEMSSRTPFLPRTFRINDVDYQLVIKDMNHLLDGEILPSIDYVPKDGDTSKNPRIHFTVSPDGRTSSSTSLEHDYALPDGSTLKTIRAFSLLGVPQYEIIEMNIPGKEMDFGEGVRPDFVRIIKEVSFEKTQGHDARKAPIKYYVEAQEGESEYSFDFSRLYPPVKSNIAYVVDIHGQVREDAPAHETKTPQALLSWFIETVDGEKMVDISREYTEMHRNMRQYLREERVRLPYEATETLYEELTSAIHSAISSEFVVDSSFFKTGDYVHLSLLTLGKEEMVDLGIGEIEVYYYPSEGKIRTNVFSLGQSLGKPDALRITKAKEVVAMTAFSDHDTQNIIEVLKDLLKDPKSDKHVSLKSLSRDELMERRLEILTDFMNEHKPVPQDLLVTLEKQARSIDPYESSYDGSLTGTPSHIRSILLNGSKTEYIPSAVYRGPSILTKQAQDRVENESLAMVEANDGKEPIRIIRLNNEVVYPDESINEQTLNLFTSKGITLPIGKFSRFGHLICVNESTYQDILKQGLEVGKATASLSPQTLDMIKGLIYLNNEIPYIHLMYRQKEDWSEDIAQKDTQFKRLSERYLRGYIDLMIGQLETGITDSQEADSKVFDEKRKMVDSTRKAIFKLKSMKGRHDDEEISDSFIYGSVILRVLELKFKGISERQQKRREAEQSIMARLEAASKDIP